jgi:hypothetical protein
MYNLIAHIINDQTYVTIAYMLYNVAYYTTGMDIFGGGKKYILQSIFETMD